MPIKLVQALDATVTLIPDPTQLPAILQLIDAVADSEPMRRLYQRMFRTLPAGQLAHLRELTLQPLDTRALARLPERTFGHHYLAFLDRHGLVPDAWLQAYPPMAPTLEKNWLLKRFYRLHDMHHVLLGFPPDVAGELGLQAFNHRNFGEPLSILALLSLPVVLVRHGREGARILEQVRRGWALAHQAENLLYAPLEDMLALDISEVRRRLGLTAVEG